MTRNGFSDFQQLWIHGGGSVAAVESDHLSTGVFQSFACFGGREVVPQFAGGMSHQINDGIHSGFLYFFQADECFAEPGQRFKQDKVDTGFGCPAELFGEHFPDFVV